MASQSPLASAALGRQAREQFVGQAEGLLTPLAESIRLRMIELVDSSPSTREMQERRDAMLDFDRQRGAWVAGTQKAWRSAVVPATATGRARLESLTFELIGDDVVENKILSSRLAMAIQEKATWELNDLRMRIQHLEGQEEMANEDVLRPEALSQLLLEQWTANGLTRQSFQLVQDVIQPQLVERVLAAYKHTNAFLVKQGVMPEIELSGRVKRGVSAPRKPTPAEGGSGGGGGSASRPSPLGEGGAGGGGGGGGGAGGGGAGGPGGSGFGASSGFATSGQGVGPSGYGGAGGGGGGGAGGPASGYGGRSTGFGGGSQGQPTRSGGPGAGFGGVNDETRMMTASTPLARAKARASGVIGQLKRLLSDKVAGFDSHHQTRPSPALAEAMSQHAGHVQTQVQAHTRSGTSSSMPGEVVIYDDAAVERVAGDLRQRTGELKKKASTQTEKATIEIVALMFQAILAEERIPPAVRVWFARLQMPVLRVAIAEPEFFGSLEHPARQLIDRMGSCVMGFDAAAIGGSALETEIKRVVQVIEQYPETGRRVFQLVYDEFQKFLSRFLTEKGPTQRLVSVAQQVEQKETMAIQYTIELRKMLNDIPVREEIREFLFKVWAEVLAVAAVKNGPQHEETVALKKSAAELVWAASAKPNRNDRARVIHDLPKLLQRLRQGMTLMGVQGAAQEAHIKIIGDTLADAFLSKTEAIAPARIEAMAKRLANLEDFVSDDPSTDLPLDAESIELMLGIDASTIEVVADGGSRPSDAMLAWAQELQLGNWFTLDHNNKTTHVQYVWRSERKQLHLFATTDGKSVLIQARRLAAYLQAGLLLPTEEEALTVRATRDALAKLDANPERLLT